ncbi:MAG: antibiotic biosynthesis monooxygenase [Saprospiraceae bacterium]|nr:antibiotic biosynthesis monooxygenase [Pyrinomonadaceae bacterium]
MNNIEKAKVMVTTTRVTVRPESRREFFQTISPLTQRIRSEKGCINYRLYEESGDENSLILIEEWEAEANWNDHRNGDNFAVLLGLVAAVGIPAKIDFKLLSQIGGNEVIKAP